MSTSPSEIYTLIEQSHQRASTANEAHQDNPLPPAEICADFWIDLGSDCGLYTRQSKGDIEIIKNRLARLFHNCAIYELHSQAIDLPTVEALCMDFAPIAPGPREDDWNVSISDIYQMVGEFVGPNPTFFELLRYMDLYIGETAMEIHVYLMLELVGCSTSALHTNYFMKAYAARDSFLTNSILTRSSVDTWRDTRRECNFEKLRMVYSQWGDLVRNASQSLVNLEVPNEFADVNKHIEHALDRVFLVLQRALNNTNRDSLATLDLDDLAIAARMGDMRAALREYLRIICASALEGSEMGLGALEMVGSSERDWVRYQTLVKSQGSTKEASLPVESRRPSGSKPDTPSNESTAAGEVKSDRAAETSSESAAPAPSGTRATAAITSDEVFQIVPPSRLPSFAAVGGMVNLKNELSDTIGLLVKHPELAAQLGIEWNGVLLYGPPGSGKTFIARAVAGEFGMNFLSVGTAELVGPYRGESAKLVDRAFQIAESHLPCLLFFDEFDSVAANRGGNASQEDRGMVNQLLRSLEGYRQVKNLIVMAATNDVDQLDEAVIRPGRFDRRVRIEYPDHESRKSILATLLEKLPAPSVDLDAVAHRSRGFSAAVLKEIVQECAMDHFRRRIRDDALTAITTEALIRVIDLRGGQDRPALAGWNWSDLVLNPTVKAELRQIQTFIENPELAERFGVAAPTGLLLYGPPGTGKTTIAKALAAETRASFYAVSCSDILSKWLGESEQRVAKLFQRARENKPSIIFIDEIDALFKARGGSAEHSHTDRVVNQFLTEIDGIGGQEGVFIVGATNRRDILDPAILRGGRLSRHIEIPLPDRPARERLLRLYTARMPVDGVNIEAIADRSAGLSGADLKALCQAAAMQAAIRSTKAPDDGPRIAAEDFDRALAAMVSNTD